MSRRIDIEQIIRGAPAPNTVRAYERDVRYFWAWARVSAGIDTPAYPVDHDLLERFVEEHVVGLDDAVNLALMQMGVKRKGGSLRIDTIRRRVVGVIREHEMRGFENTFRTPRMRALMRGAKRWETQQGVVKRKARAITARMLDRIIDSYRGVKGLKEKRDIAMMVWAFYTGGRRNSEVVDARYEFLSRFHGGYRYFLYRSKTDQVGRGAEKILRAPHARHLTAWLTAAGITDGYLFRRIDAGGRVTGDRVGQNALSRAIKQRVEVLGYDPRFFSAHSLRRGFVTQCGMDGVPLSEAMQCTGHKNVVVAMEYYEEGRIDGNAATRLNTKRKGR